MFELVRKFALTLNCLQFSFLRQGKIKMRKSLPSLLSRDQLMDVQIQIYRLYENNVLFSNDTGILGKRNSEFSQQESSLRPSDY